jgi:hypothetical protein
MARAKRLYDPGLRTRSIAVRNKSFVEKVKAVLGFWPRGKEVIEGSEGYQLRERADGYHALSEAENDDIGLGNSYLWKIKAE